MVESMGTQRELEAFHGVAFIVDNQNGTIWLLSLFRHSTDLVIITADSIGTPKQTQGVMSSAGSNN